jgi:hypothetical protein
VDFEFWSFHVRIFLFDFFDGILPRAAISRGRLNNVSALVVRGIRGFLALVPLM